MRNPRYWSQMTQCSLYVVGVIVNYAPMGFGGQHLLTDAELMHIPSWQVPSAGAVHDATKLMLRPSPTEYPFQ